MMSTIEAPPERPTTIVGQRVLRSEGRGLVSGRAKYIADLYLPGMLHVKAKLAPYANARILSIDTSRAEALPGVVTVVTHRVLVPAGIVLKDPLALTDPVLFPRERVASLRPLPYPTTPAADVCDLRLGAVAGSLVLELTEEATLVRTNVRRRGGELVRARRLAFSPRLSDQLLAEATRRRTASPG